MSEHTPKQCSAVGGLVRRSGGVGCVWGYSITTTTVFFSGQGVDKTPTVSRQ